MELRQLLSLDAVLETGSFAAAAKVRHVAQPAVWAQVKSLEAEWGVALFERVGRRVRPTPAARAIRPLLEHTLASARELHGEVENVRRGHAAPARVACAQHHVSYFLARVIAEYRARYPDAPLPTIVPMTLGETDAALTRGDVDLSVSLRSPNSSFDGVVLYSTWVVVAHASLGRRASIEARDLRGLSIATLPRDFVVRQLLDQMCSRARFSPNVVLESRTTPSLLALARAGVAHAVVAMEALSEVPPVPAARLAERGVVHERSIYLQWRSDASLSPAAARLRDVIREHAPAPRAAAKRRK